MRTNLIRARKNKGWTQEGRLFIYNLLAQNGIYPLVEREDLKHGDVQTRLEGM